jgi:glycosyltransferase involved in cell wall biosynthesis
MKILVISRFLPTPDRASGDLRFFTLLCMIAKQHSITLCVLEGADQIEELGHQTYSSYKTGLNFGGVTLVENLWSPLCVEKWDAVVFEFYQPAIRLLDEVRFRQPSARIIIDSVDVHFRRYEAKASLSDDHRDIDFARHVKAEELDIYGRADMVVVVTEDDKQTLREQNPHLSVAVLPNVHQIHTPMTPKDAKPNSLIFVGGFKHEPNVDAMIYFCSEILPLIRQRIPTTHLTIVGSHPTDAIRSLASSNVEITGFVPDTTPYLRKSSVSIAPLRYGAGMKGKIGEAMSHGLPVVTTNTGAEGFGLTPGKELLVGNSAAAFADHVINLLQDAALHESIRLSGWEFMRSNYSTESVEHLCSTFLAQVQITPIHTMSPLSRLRRSAREFYEQNIAWRFR